MQEQEQRSRLGCKCRTPGIETHAMDNNRAEDEIERAELGRKTEGIGNRTRTETEEALGGAWRCEGAKGDAKVLRPRMGCAARYRTSPWI